MAEWMRLARYPFLPEVQQAVRSSGVDLGGVLDALRHSGARQRALHRVEGALGQGFPPARIGSDREALEELLSVAVARMLVARLGEKVLVQRYAAAEAEQVRLALLAETANEPYLAAAEALGITAEAVEHGWRMHVSDYVRNAPLDEPAWKLIRRTVAAGHLVLPAKDLARLVEEALRRRIAGELEAERGRPMPPGVAASLAPLVAELQPRLEQARANWSTGDFGPVQPGLFPPCVKETFEALKRSENVPHHGRFAFATFLRTVGWNAEQIMDFLAATPNFDREKSRYQIEHITGERGVEAYMVPNCSTMQTNGVCPLDKRDALCMRIKNPLSYYRAKVRSNAAPEPVAVPAAPAQPAAPAPPASGPAGGPP